MPVETPELAAAVQLAQFAHREQTEFAGNPYTDHLNRVCVLLINKWPSLLFDKYIMCIAILHDTIEDTDVTEFQLQQEFGTVVARTVAVLSRDKERVTYQDFIHSIVVSGNLRALMVKWANVKDHLRLDDTNNEYHKNHPGMLQRYNAALVILEDEITRRKDEIETLIAF